MLHSENLRKDESRWRGIANEAVLVKQLALDVNGVRALLATNTQTAADINQKVVAAEKHLTRQNVYTLDRLLLTDLLGCGRDCQSLNGNRLLQFAYE